MAKSNAMGYMPNDSPPMGQLILRGFQHVLTMFPATVFVAAFCGFHVGTVLLASGVSTIVALVLSRRGIGTFIPLFYGSSFSYIAAYLGIIQKMTGSAYVSFSGPVADNVLSTLQAGIIVTGILNIIVGFIIRAVGKASLDKVLPPIVTGSVAAIIGFGLAFAALGLAQNNWGVAIVTLLVTIFCSVYLQGKGFFGMLPILIGAVFGYVFSALVAPDSVNWSGVTSTAWFAMPHITFPSFSGEFVGAAIFSISIMAIATIPESTAHLYQMSLYIDRFAEETGREKTHLDKNIGFNLMLDGLGDFLNGLFGATAGTNYGENNSLMAITRNYSGPALIAAGVIAVLLGFIGKLEAGILIIPGLTVGQQHDTVDAVPRYPFLHFRETGGKAIGYLGAAADDHAGETRLDLVPVLRRPARDQRLDLVVEDRDGDQVVIAQMVHHVAHSLLEVVHLLAVHGTAPVQDQRNVSRHGCGGRPGAGLDVHQRVDCLFAVGHRQRVLAHDAADVQFVLHDFLLYSQKIANRKSSSLTLIEADQDPDKSGYCNVVIMLFHSSICRRLEAPTSGICLKGFDLIQKFSLRTPHSTLRT